MRNAAIVFIFAFAAASCSPEPEVTSNKCATDLYPSYNPEVRDQCVDVCRKCDHGTRATCSTSCFLKGAH